MKRFLAAVLVVLMVCTGSANAFAVNEDVEGKLLIYTSMYPFVVDMLNEAIAKEFPNLEGGASDGTFFFYNGTSSLIQQVYGEMENGRLGCDMMMVAEPAFSLELKEAGYLESIEVDQAEDMLLFPYDEEGYWYPVRVCNMILAYNPEKEADWEAKGVTIPRSFKDFAEDPALKGYISMGDPLTSGTSYAAIVSLLDQYGEDYFHALAANGVYRESGSTATAKLSSGECAAIMILEESVLKELKDAEDRGTPRKDLACIYPDDGVILIPSTIMTVAEARSANMNLDACEAVEQWLFTQEAQELIQKGFMHSVLADLKEVPEGSIDTELLIAKDMGVDWEKAYHDREKINRLWTEIVTR